MDKIDKMLANRWEEMKLSEKIANELFINGSGEEAQRLVLELLGGGNGGGLCKQAVIDLIEKAVQHANAADYESKLIRSRLGKDEKCHAIYLVDGTKINIKRDGGMGAWLEIGPAPKITLACPTRRRGGSKTMQVQRCLPF